MLPTFDIPPIGPRQGKRWGTTQLLFARNGTEAHRIEFITGVPCSKHRHLAKWNRFVVLSGEMRVTIFRDDEKRDETTIRRGQVTDVPPGVWHQFEGIAEGEALEFYWVNLEAGDIERENTGAEE